jgi:hypothetical protein
MLKALRIGAAVTKKQVLHISLLLVREGLSLCEEEQKGGERATKEECQELLVIVFDSQELRGKPEKQRTALPHLKEEREEDRYCKREEEKRG